MTAWAHRLGWGCAPIPRLPPIQTTGDVRGLLAFPPEILREDLMLVTALHMGLRPEIALDRGVPLRRVASDITDKDLPVDHIYIGPGHFSHRWPVGPWANHFKPGRDGTAFEVVFLYMQWIQTQLALLQDLHHLRGKVLVCDCPHSQLCHGDVLAALLWSSSDAASVGPSPPRPPGWVLAAASGTRMVSAVPLTFPHESVVAAFQSLCFSISWTGFKFPMVEDLLLDSCFSSFRNWRRDNCLLPDMPAGPRVVSLSERSMFRMTLGVQTAPPLVPFGLGADGRFAALSEFCTLGTPFEHDPLADDDLWFAAEQTALHYGCARTERERVCRVLSELGRRWQPVTDYLRSCQPWEVAKATAGRHLGLLGLLGLLMDWPDPTFLHNLLVGFPSIGFSPHVPSFTSQPGHWISWDDIWETSYSDALRILTSLKPGTLDTEIVKAGEKDEHLGFCSAPLSWGDLLRAGGGSKMNVGHVACVAGAILGPFFDERS